MAEPDTWAPLADRFVDGYGTLRGRVRTYVIDAHLRAHLPPPPASLIDVGGGAGDQSIPLAARGYEVTIADPSQAMLDRAAARLASGPAPTASRVRLVRAGAENAAWALGGRRFDGVLCHGVIMYVDDPRPFTYALAGLAESGGIVSLVAKNAACLAVQPALQGRWADALTAFDAGRQVNGLGLDSRADTVDGLTALLAEAGVDQVTWYGVRLFTDGWTPPVADPPDSDDHACLVELEASRRDPYRQLSRLFHLVGVRR
ncbi:MAG TPA: methyltransferase [Streptosporangiaceae bacterium]|nr:methyltransferase [Streptosporangiaceae bacterium]